jgi:murein DD-endopeptidase MepM/ murein hydrolase activator NlpD
VQTSRSRHSPAPSGTQKVIWSWPASGRVIRGYNAKSAGKKGVDIAGKTGESVRAAAAGKVVYAGSGLSGYGRLIISDPVAFRNTQARSPGRSISLFTQTVAARAWGTLVIR